MFWAGSRGSTQCQEPAPASGRIQCGGRSGGGRLVFGLVVVGIARGKPDFDPRDLADTPVAHQLASLPEVFSGPLPTTRLPDPLILLLRVHDALAFVERVGQRLFAVDVLPVAQRHYGRDAVPVVRQRNGDRVDVVAEQNLLVSPVGHVLIAISFVDFGFSGRQNIRVDIADGDVLAALDVAEFSQVVAAHPSHPDGGEGDAIRSRDTSIAAQRLGLDVHRESGYGRRGRGNAGKKVSAGHR